MQNNACSHAHCKNPATLFMLRLDSSGAVLEQAFCLEHQAEAGIQVMTPDLDAAGELRLHQSYIDCRFDAVVFMHDRNEYAVLLRGRAQPRSAFLFQTGYVEACGLYTIARQSSSHYPGPHVLILDLAERLGAKLDKAVVDGYVRSEQRYECAITVRAQNGAHNLKCRLSDAVALSILNRTAIEVNQRFMGEFLTSAQ